MRILVPFSALLLLIVACNTTKESNTAVSEPPIEVREEPVKEVTANYRDTIMETDSTFEIGKACGVFFTPSDAQLQRLREEIGEDDFFTVMDDYGWYFAESTTYLEDHGIRTIMTSEKSARFHLLDGTVKTFHVSDSAPDWSPVLFNGKNTVQRIDLVNITAGYEAVFR